MKRIQKDYQTTPLTGLVEDSLLSNSNSNAPSINAVRSALTPPQNLLINGDFQINQRGQSSYSISQISSYTVDMWKVDSSNATLEFMEDGIKITNGNVISYLTQMFTRNMMGRFYNLVMVKKVTGVARVYGKEEMTLTTGLNVFSFELDTQTTSFNIELQPNTVLYLKYIDLFEGDVVYKHVKEDSAIALMRCQTKLIYNVACSIDVVYRNGSHIVGRTYIPKMEKVPEVTVKAIGYYTAGGSAMQIPKGDDSVKYTVYNDLIIFNFQLPQEISAGFNLWTNVDLSCEPY